MNGEFAVNLVVVPNELIRVAFPWGANSICQLTPLLPLTRSAPTPVFSAIIAPSDSLHFSRTPARNLFAISMTVLSLPKAFLLLFACAVVAALCRIRTAIVASEGNTLSIYMNRCSVPTAFLVLAACVVVDALCRLRNAVGASEGCVLRRPRGGKGPMRSDKLPVSSLRCWTRVAPGGYRIPDLGYLEFVGCMSILEWEDAAARDESLAAFLVPLGLRWVH